MTQPEIREIKALLEKYWQAETTLEEERQLADYFAQPDIDPELASFRPMFDWLEEESQLTPDEGFDHRILQRIGLAEQRIAPVHRLRTRSIGYAAAAAVILCIAIGFFLSTGPGTTPPPPAVAQGAPAAAPGNSAVQANPATREIQIKDTYDDPQKALAAVRHALLIASVRINQGRHITQKNIARLHNSWQAATGD
jgi:hypothetical protein